MISKPLRTAFGVSEVARRWGVSVFTIRRFVQRGLLRSFNVGSRKLITTAELARVEKHGLGPRKAKGTTDLGEVTECLTK
ncbi:MAG: helix-turn-helix domain-containing protein [Terriglobales bacterium]